MPEALHGTKTLFSAGDIAGPHRQFLQNLAFYLPPQVQGLNVQGLNRVRSNSSLTPLAGRAYIASCRELRSQTRRPALTKSRRKATQASASTLPPELSLMKQHDHNETLQKNPKRGCRAIRGYP